MLGLTNLPPWFEQAFEQFESIVSDKRNIASFNSFMGAVIMSHSKWIISGLYQGTSRLRTAMLLEAEGLSPVFR